MKFALQSSTDGYHIKAYSPGEITLTFLDIGKLQQANSDQQAVKLKEEKLNNSIVISPEKLVRDWPVHTFADLEQTHLATISEMKPEVVLLGTGERLLFPEQQWIGYFHQQGIGFEVMDTAAACRTYNILTAENRHAVAALIIN